jgi:hypothetical protein
VAPFLVWGRSDVTSDSPTRTVVRAIRHSCGNGSRGDESLINALLFDCELGSFPDRHH